MTNPNRTPAPGEAATLDWYLRAKIADVLHLLQYATITTPSFGDDLLAVAAMDDLRKYLANRLALAPQPAQGVQAAAEAVSHTIASGEEGITVAFFHSNHAPHGTSLYLAAPTVADRVPLSDEQIMEMAGEPDTSNAFEEDADRREMIAFARAIEAAHGIGAEKTA